jgi:hypothetical protein
VCLYVRDGFVQASSPNSAYVHTCQAGCHGRLSATIFFFFFPPAFIYLFLFTSDNSSAPHVSWQLLWDRLAYQDPRQVFELFFKILSSVRASTSSCRVPRVKRSKNTPKIFIRISSLPNEKRKTKKEKKI